MAITFVDGRTSPLADVSGEVPAGAVVGLVGDERCGAEALLELAEAQGKASGPAPGENIVLNQPFALDDGVAREKGIAELNRARRRGAAILLFSHDLSLIERLCDEVWWLDGGRLVHRGAPGETLERYRHHVASRLRAEQGEQELAPSFRRGDGRAELVSLQTFSAGDQPSSVWASGEPAGVRVRVRFHAAVDDPVVGMLIRTRVGLDVFGTNTQLEAVKLGPVAAGAEKEVLFRFNCALCPQEYTITAASHDPDGVWHDWMEDAIAVTVTDTRYTAGVANLRAAVEVR